MNSATRHTRTLLNSSVWTVESQVFYVNVNQTLKLKFFDTSLGVSRGKVQHLSNSFKIYLIGSKNAIGIVFCGCVDVDTL